MNYLAVLIPIALAMGAVGLLAFLWSLRSGQYDDLDGAAERVLLDDEADEAPMAGEGTVSRYQRSRSEDNDEPKLHPGGSNAEQG
ncbi:cbb3-type cytochrome oxidase assembly protein CcoS [Sinorhizobium sp. 8-89]|uniref:cbb3-type cytochrome oxidase assembly protein CcoS n=1 Tax=Sinorhizobium sp. 7-81 TaxID=3049087 RepID=UPI0024C42894|nr:cbb3-type cytochrome oxidase assembly protein CcoS [Sinorhizobium sp. 7-81]MDK1388778.1 cbb3-type cytochrome oxidase assembly protein CcoS [Sinorhizobium sp. 7-81]